MKVVWDESAWADHLWWQAQDLKVLKLRPLNPTDRAQGSRRPSTIPAPNPATSSSVPASIHGRLASIRRIS